MGRPISRAVWVLSLISLFTDMASEMLYPVFPVYLQHIGYSVVFIGVLEGLAEAVAGLSKGYFGKLSDYRGKRVPFVQWGYGLSALSKPLLAAFVFPLWIFICRTIDRLGKGIRTGARDALLSAAAEPGQKASVFGFHRSMDTLGAVLGPSLALGFLYLYPENYIALFLLAAVPGLLAVLSTRLLKENRIIPKQEGPAPSFFSFLGYWKTAPANYRKLVTGLLLFTLFNSSDVFLLLKGKEAGWSDTAVIGVYILYNAVYAIFAFPLGRLADKIGVKRIFIAGLFAFAIVYTGMAISGSLAVYIGLFVLYGIYAAATEGISKAWIAQISQTAELGTAMGNFTALQSMATFLASSVTGFVWFQFGAATALIITATGALLTVFIINRIPEPPNA